MRYTDRPYAGMLSNFKQYSIGYAHSSINHTIALAIRISQQVIELKLWFPIVYVSAVKIQRLERQRLLSVLERKIIEKRYFNNYKFDRCCFLQQWFVELEALVRSHYSFGPSSS